MFDSASLFLSCGRPDQLPDHDFNEIVMVGKSNVGKSSLINAVCNRKNLAYVGSAPGKTRLINFFEVDESWMLVDVPGYGYAKMPKKEIERIDQLMHAYFNDRKQIKGMFVLVDVRRGLSEHDQSMLDLAEQLEIEATVVFTKADKVSNNEIARIKQLNKDQHLLFFSALKKQGIQAIQEKIVEWLNN
jgi:GTP-binding protein